MSGQKSQTHDTQADVEADKVELRQAWDDLMDDQRFQVIGQIEGPHGMQEPLLVGGDIDGPPVVWRDRDGHHRTEIAGNRSR